MLNKRGRTQQILDCHTTVTNVVIGQNLSSLGFGLTSSNNSTLTTKTVSGEADNGVPAFWIALQICTQNNLLASSEGTCRFTL